MAIIIFTPSLESQVSIWLPKKELRLTLWEPGLTPGVKSKKRKYKKETHCTSVIILCTGDKCFKYKKIQHSRKVSLLLNTFLFVTDFESHKFIEVRIINFRKIIFMNYFEGQKSKLRNPRAWNRFEIEIVKINTDKHTAYIDNWCGRIERNGYSWSLQSEDPKGCFGRLKTPRSATHVTLRKILVTKKLGET